MKRLALALFALLLSAAARAATPTISSATWTGALLYKATVTLTTTNASTRSATVPLPFIYADGEEGTINPHSIYSTSTTWSANQNVIYFTSNCYAGTGCLGSDSNWADSTAGSDQGDITLKIQHMILTPGTTFHYQWVWKGDIIAFSTNNWKVWRHWPKDWEGTQRYANHYWATQTNDDFLMFHENDGSIYTTTSLDRMYISPFSAGNSSRKPLPKSDAWHVIDVYYRTSSGPYAVDGSFTGMIDGVVVAQDTSMRDKYNIAGGAPSNQTDEPAVFFFQCQFSPASPPQPYPLSTLYLHYDNLVLDVGNAHVEVSTSATNAAGGHRLFAPLIAAGWSPTSVKFVMPQGGYTNGQTLYVYVYNDQREVNAAGYAVEYNLDLAPASGDSGGGAVVPSTHPLANYRIPAVRR